MKTISTKECSNSGGIYIMIKWTTLFSGMAVATLLLTGCGTASNDEATDTPSTNESQKISTQTEEASTTDSQTNAYKQKTQMQQTTKLALHKRKTQM